jgi:signal transduction histidine kinase
MKKYFTLTYHPDLIKLFISLSDRSGFSSLISAFFMMVVFYNKIPVDILSLWFIFSLAYVFMKVTIVNRIGVNLGNKKRLHYYMILLVAVTAFSGILWGAASWMVIIYVKSNYEFLLLGITFGLIAGGISTLSMLFVVYLAFSLPMIVLLFSSFIYAADEVHGYIAILMILFSYIVISASYRMYKTLDDSIYLKELIEESQYELEKVNISLESRVVQEVEKRREQELKLLQQSRLAQMGEMMSMIAHQWRQPLAAIASTAASLQLKMTLGKYDQELFSKNIAKISQFSQHLSVTIDDFRNFFKSNKKQEYFHLSEVTQGALNIIGTSLKNRNIEVISSYEESRKIYSYFNELKQVALNLLKNAEDILILKKIENPKIWIRIMQDDTGIVLEVEDNAGGIDPEILPKIFDPYFTTKEQFDGTGLGLYMSRTIVEEHCGGNIYVKNGVQGAIFSVVLKTTQKEHLPADEIQSDPPESH